MKQLYRRRSFVKIGLVCALFALLACKRANEHVENSSHPVDTGWSNTYLLNIDDEKIETTYPGFLDNSWRSFERNELFENNFQKIFTKKYPVSLSSKQNEQVRDLYKKFEEHWYKKDIANGTKKIHLLAKENIICHWVVKGEIFNCMRADDSKFLLVYFFDNKRNFIVGVNL